MRVFDSIAGIRSWLKEIRAEGKRVGLVPTMGYLHEGHLSLMRRAKEECDSVVVSIFVNPAQFGPTEDFDRYPRDFERDRLMAEEVGVDGVFAPLASEMYPEGYVTYVEVGGITEGLCGASRPGHFRGVATVVAKLFNIVEPESAYFGRKDAQQLLVISRMVRDLNMDINIVSVPIVREADGLAMSSRNRYLSPEERRAAAVLYRSLRSAKDAIDEGERDPKAIKKLIAGLISEEPSARIEYVSITDSEELSEVKRIEGSTLIAIAVWIGNTRLIDNIVAEVW